MKQKERRGKETAMRGLAMTGTKRRRGAMLVEFTLVLPLLLFILFSIIEIARVMNAWVTIRDIAIDAAVYGSRPDATLSRSPSEIISYTLRQLDRVPWVTDWRDESVTTDFIEVDVNKLDTQGTYNTQVRIRFTMEPVLIPKFYGDIPVFTIDTTAMVRNLTKSLNTGSNAKKDSSGNPYTAVKRYF